jgi:lactoylglutathione lyase
MSIAAVRLPVGDIERAISFYTRTLGWAKVQDASMGNGDRWVTVAPIGSPTAFSLTQDKAPHSATEGGCFSGVILEVDDVYKIRDLLKARGVAFTEEPRDMAWGSWAMFKDCEGNAHGLHSPLRERASTH